MSDVPEIEAGRGLWRRLPRQPVQTGDTIGAVDLAAWVDGRLDERASARIEAALLANPQLLETAIAARAALIDAADDAARLVVRAQALVPAPLRVPQSKPHWLAGVFAPRGLQWAAIGAAMLIAGVGGFSLGDNVAQEIQTFDSQQSTILYGLPGGNDPLAAYDDDEA